MQCAQKEWSIGWTVHCFTIVNVSDIKECAFTRWEWRRMPNSYDFWLQFRHGITLRFTKPFTNGFRSSFEMLEVHHELSNLIANLRTKGSILRESSKFASYEFLKLTSTSKLLLTLNWYFIMAHLSNLMETFKDKMDEKSYQWIFETHTANHFTGRLQLVLFNTPDQIAHLSMNAMGHFQANTHCLPPICSGSHCCKRWSLLVPGLSRLGLSWTLPWAVTSPRDTPRKPKLLFFTLGIQTFVLP